jgi:hypothetical protein
MDENVTPDRNEDNAREIMADDDNQTKETPPCTVPSGLTLENIIDLTGELEHLNELIMLELDKSGGFTSTESYFSAVQPVLDLLEIEIRIRYRPDMNIQEMKLLVQDWIDKEMAESKKR